VRQQLASTAGQAGQIELLFNGDFFAFAQAKQEAYRSRLPDYWCSAPESLEKLEVILAGHANRFGCGSFRPREIACAIRDMIYQWVVEGCLGGRM
jgi:hypothetical protein